MKRALALLIGTGLSFLLQLAAPAHAAGFDSRYVARVGDINGDGLSDIYLRYAPELAFVGVDDILVPVPRTKSIYRELALTRNASGGFDLITSPSPAQRAVGAASPRANLRFASDDYTGDGESDLAILSVGSSIPGAGDVVVSAPHGASPAAVLNGRVSQRYHVRQGDINGDGKTDFFVTGNASRFVGDFILQQITPESFQITAQPTSVQRQSATAWPTSPVAVFREDLNLDGYYDFFLEGIDAVIANGADLIVYTQKNNGQAPVKSVPVDDEFNNLVQRVATILTNGPETLEDFYEYVCTTSAVTSSTGLEYYLYDWLTNRYPDGWYYERYLDLYGQILHFNTPPLISERSCVTKGRVYYFAAEQNLIRSWGDYLGLGGVNCAECGQRARGQIENNPDWSTTGAVGTTAAVVARYAFILTGILVADDATVVGVADDVLIPITAGIAAGALVVHVIAQSQAGEDVGPTSAPPAVSTPADPFQIPPEFDPNDPNGQDRAGPNGTGNAERLARNLTKNGWPKPHPDAQAHHIVQKWPSNPPPSILQSRAILNRYGIDIDEAANGVWLPARNIPGSAARGHLTRGMHTEKYREAVLNRIRDAELRGGGQANPQGAAREIRVELQKIGKDLLTKPDLFW